MQLSLSSLSLMLLAGLGALYFLSALRVRELAVQAVARQARVDNFQLLDQSVHIRRVSLSRDATGRWRVWRQYRFDYSYDGTERQRGQVIMLGKQLQAVVVTEVPPTLH